MHQCWIGTLTSCSPVPTPSSLALCDRPRIRGLHRKLLQASERTARHSAECNKAIPETALRSVVSVAFADVETVVNAADQGEQFRTVAREQLPHGLLRRTAR
jgi:hypothetical protein